MASVWLLLVAALIAFSLSCSGDKKPNSSDGSSGGDGGSSSNGVGVASLPKPVAVDLPAGQALLGPNDEDTVEAITAALNKSGLNLNGIQLSVFPVANAHQSLLVMDMDATKLAESADEAYTAALAALINLPEAQGGESHPCSDQHARQGCSG